MSRHRGKFYLEMLALCFGGMVVAGILLVWWLIQAPLQLDFLRAPLQNAIIRQTGLRPTIGHLVFAWDGKGTPLQIQLSEVTLQTPQGDTVASFQSAALGLWLRPLLAGEIRPLSLTVIEPEITATRQVDGTYSLGFGGGQGQPLPQLLAQIFTPDPNSDLANWEQAGIRQGHLVFLDEHAQPIGQINGIDIAISRQVTGVTAKVESELQVDTLKSPLSAHIDYVAKTGMLALHLQTGDLPLNLLSGLSPELADLNGVEIPAAVTLDARFAQGFSFDTAHLLVNLGEGRIDRPDVFASPVPISSGAIDLGYTASPQRIDLYGAGVNLQGPTIEASAVASLGSDNSWHFDLTGGFKTTPAERLLELWPWKAAPGGYKWVTKNITQGTIDDGTIHVIGHSSAATPSEIQLDDLNGGFKVTGATIHYFGDLPPAEGAAGSATFDQQALTITLTEGHAGSLNLTSGTLLIDKLPDELQTLSIDAGLAGPVGGALDILNHPPLFYANKVKLDPRAITGSGTTQLHLDFPLIAALNFKEVNLHAISSLQDVTLPNTIGKHAIENLNGTLDVDPTRLNLTGQAVIETMPVDLTVRRNFNHQDGLDTDLDFRADLTEAGREKLGVAVPERLTGVVGVIGKYQDSGPAATLALQLNLDKAVLKLAELDFVKPVGEAAGGSLRVDLENGEVRQIDNIDLRSRRMLIQGAAELDPATSDLRQLSIKRLKLDNTDIVLNVAVRPDGTTKMAISGPVLDVENLINEKHQEGETSTTAPAKDTLTEVDVDIGSLRTSAKSHVDSVKGTLNLKGRSWQDANFQALARGHSLTFAYQPDPAQTGLEHLLVQTEDAGAFLAGFGLNDSVRGGRLQIDGQQPPKPVAGPRPPLSGHLDLEDFRLVGTPVVARMLSLLSLTGFLESFSGQGIAFDALTGDFTVGNTEITINNGKLAGSALGLTIFGTADRDAGTLNLHGTAVPFYSVNQFLNKIPVLGTMLTGGKGQGMFAANYSVKGSFDKPEVGINPLSVLTPGILRDLFFFRSQPTPDEGAGSDQAR